MTNGYVAFWKGQQTEVWAETAYDAQKAAVTVFQKNTRKKVKDFDVQVWLAEKNGQQVVHVADF